VLSLYNYLGDLQASRAGSCSALVVFVSNGKVAESFPYVLYYAGYYSLFMLAVYACCYSVSLYDHSVIRSSLVVSYSVCCVGSLYAYA